MLDLILKPALPKPGFTKSTEIGFALSYKFFSITNVMFSSLKTRSFSFCSSRAKPRLGPPQPGCSRILKACGAFCFPHILLIMLPASSVTVNINPPADEKRFIFKIRVVQQQLQPDGPHLVDFEKLMFFPTNWTIFLPPHLGQTGFRPASFSLMDTVTSAFAPQSRQPYS